MHALSIRQPRASLLAVGLLLASAFPASTLAQDLTLEYETRMEFGGAMGQMMRMMPGMGSISEPQREVIRIHGLMMRTDYGDETSTIVDAEARRFIQIDHEEKSYTVMTPEDMARMAQQARAQMAAAMDSIEAEQPDAPARPEGEPELRVAARVETERTGRDERVAGLDADQWYLTLFADFEMEEEGENPMFLGSTVSFSDMWMSEEAPGGEEQEQVWRALGQEMIGAMGIDDGMDAVFAVNPQFKVMVEQNRDAMAAMEGTAVRTTTLMVLVPPGAEFERERALEDLEGELSQSMSALAGAAAGDAARGAAAGAARGALGRLGGGLFGRGNRNQEPEEEEAPPPPSQTTMLRMVEELQRVERGPVSPDIFAIPEGYREIDIQALMSGRPG